MDQNLRFRALTGLRKSASSSIINRTEITAEYLQGFRKVAEDFGISKLELSKDDLSPEYIQGFCKAAEDAGVNPADLMKLAGFWGDLWDGTKSVVRGVTGAATGAIGGTIGAIGGVGKGIYDAFAGDEGSWYGRLGKGIADTTVDGAKAGWYLPEVVADEGADIAQNLGHGALNMALGFGRGVANLPGFITGLGTGAVGLGKGLLWDSWHGDEGTWYGRIWDNATGGYDMGANFVNSLGPGRFDLNHLNDTFKDWQNTNMNAYMAHNNIDPNNMDFLDRAATFGVNLAGTSGELLGDAVGFGAAGKLAKGTGRVLLGAAKGADKAKKVVTPAAEAAKNVGKWQKFKNGAKAAGKYGYAGGVNGLMAYGRTVEDINNRAAAMGNGSYDDDSSFDPYGTTNVSGRISY